MKNYAHHNVDVKICVRPSRDVKTPLALRKSNVVLHLYIFLAYGPVATRAIIRQQINYTLGHFSFTGTASDEHPWTRKYVDLSATTPPPTGYSK